MVQTKLRRRLPRVIRPLRRSIFKRKARLETGKQRVTALGSEYSDAIEKPVSVHPWSLVFGLWSLVFGLWSLVFGLWSLVFGLWSLILVFDPRLTPKVLANFSPGLS